MLRRLLPPRSIAALMLIAVGTPSALGWSIPINQASRRVYLHVGNGAPAGNSGATSGPINLVRVSVPANQLGNGVAQAMTSNSTQSNSLQGDNYLTCPTPSSQLLIGASYQRNNNGAPASATLRVSSPAVLTNANGDTIPISEIGWTVGAPGSSAPNVIPAGTFSGSSQFLATIPANTYIENCHSFRYANSVMRAAGTYTARVTYTVTSP